MRRKISLFLSTILIAGLAIINNGCSSGNSNEYNDGDESVNFNINETKMQERLGKDDGYAFTVFYGADTHGSLEDCGCPSHPMGGLARRISYIKAFKHRSNGEVPALFVDAGNLFTDDKYDNTELPTPSVTKNKWVTKAYGDFRHDAANISYIDLPYVAELLKKDGYDQRIQEYPFIKKLVSSNVHPADDRNQSPARYLIREVTLKRGNPNQKIKIGIIGLTAPKPPTMNPTETSRAGFVIDDPFQAAKRVIAELKPKVDFIIALAYMQQEELQRLASENPEIDSIIGASGSTSMDDPVHFNRATITKAYNQMKFMGELRYYMRSDGSLENQINRYVGLDAIIPDDPIALEMTTFAHDEYTNENNKSMKASVPPTSILSGKDSPAINPDKLLEKPPQKP